MPEVTLYSKEGCPFVAKLINELQEKAVDYEEINLTYDQEALQKVKEQYGADRVPFLVEGDNVTIGYHGSMG